MASRSIIEVTSFAGMGVNMLTVLVFQIAWSSHGEFFLNVPFEVSCVFLQASSPNASPYERPLPYPGRRGYDMSLDNR